MAYRVNESYADDDERTLVKKIAWECEDEFDSSEDEDDHSIYFQHQQRHYWYCSECKTCITQDCLVDSNNQHFQLNKDTGEYFPTSITMNGKLYKLIIHRDKDIEVFGYFSSACWGSS